MTESERGGRQMTDQTKCGAWRAGVRRSHVPGPPPRSRSRRHDGLSCSRPGFRRGLRGHGGGPPPGGCWGGVRRPTLYS
jgi:hypothetical protein